MVSAEKIIAEKRTECFTLCIAVGFAKLTVLPYPAHQALDLYR